MANVRTVVGEYKEGLQQVWLYHWIAQIFYHNWQRLRNESKHFVAMDNTPVFLLFISPRFSVFSRVFFFSILFCFATTIVLEFSLLRSLKPFFHDHHISLNLRCFFCFFFTFCFLIFCIVYYCSDSNSSPITMAYFLYSV